jgi:ABC-2 type transport system ATP-binding protein
VAIIDRGQIIALDTPRRLIAGSAVDQRISFTIEGSLGIQDLQQLPGTTRALSDGKGQFTVQTRESQPLLKALIELGESRGLRLLGLQVQGATLEDVFIRLTGRRIRA